MLSFEWIFAKKDKSSNGTSFSSTSSMKVDSAILSSSLIGSNSSIESFEGGLVSYSCVSSKSISRLISKLAALNPRAFRRIEVVENWFINFRCANKSVEPACSTT